MARVMAALSGGVDSSVAAALLQAAGHQVVGVTLKLLDLPETLASDRGCCALDAVRRANFRTATRDGVPVAGEIRLPFEFRLK